MSDHGETSEIEEYFEPVIETKKEQTPYWKTIILVKYFMILLNYPGFRYLWLGNFVGLFGDFFNYIACIQLLNLYLPNSTSIAFAFYILMESLPSVFISPLAGVVADRFDRRKIMLFFDLIRSLVVLSNLLYEEKKRYGYYI
eukprot:gene10032-2351_t